MSTSNGDAQALPDARVAAAEARLLADAWSRWRAYARELHDRGRAVAACLPDDGHRRDCLRFSLLADGSRAATFASRVVQGLNSAADALERLAELEYLERAVKGSGG